MRSTKQVITLSLPRVPYGTRHYYLLNIGSICIKFGHQTDLGEIFYFLLWTLFNLHVICYSLKFVFAGMIYAMSQTKPFNWYITFGIWAGSQLPFSKNIAFPGGSDTDNNRP